MRTTLVIGACAALAGALVLDLKSAPASHAAAPGEPGVCDSLRTLNLPSVRVDAVTRVTPQAAWSPAEGARPVAVKAPFCRVQGTIETEIGFELWLPEPGAWNGKFLGAGVGGDAGTFNFQDLPRGVARGYAAATTDTGHKAADRTWMLGDPMRLTNYALRGNHRLAEVSKDIVARFYGRPVRLSYFIGCSGGGRQGLKEMQRFPADYDGIIAGAPGPDTAEMTARRMWEIIQRESHPGLMSPKDWQFVADQGVKACDGLDGVKDGVAEDPRVCKFDPGVLQCKSGQTTECLSPAQAALARAIYAPLHDETGKQLDGGLLPGVLVDSGRSRLAPATFGQAIRRQSDWNGEGFKLSEDLPAIGRAIPELKADDVRIEPFRDRGGKAIIYQGWIDPAVASRMTTAYYERLQAAMGGPTKANKFLRLYMAPGALHCAGGPGPDQFGAAGADAPLPDADHDLLSAMERWVEKGVAPGPVIASKVADGKVVRTRPLCPYPQKARYTGKGSTDDAANFRCSK